MRYFTAFLAAALSAGFVRSSSENTGENDSSLFWSTYRANLYFGLRPRVPNTLMTGLMWHGLNDYQSILSAYRRHSLPRSEGIFTPFIETRHACEQGDELKGYTWTEHDVRYGGIQVLNDTLNNVQITTEWLKEPGGDNGGSWAARIKGRPLLPGQPKFLSTQIHGNSDLMRLQYRLFH